MKIVEILFPELCGLYGDKMNMVYLGKCSKKIKFIETNHKEEPYFVKHKVDMVYIGPMTEMNQEKFISLLIKYKNRIKDLVNKGIVFFITGNAIELFGKFIKTENSQIECLNIFDFYSVRDMSDIKNYQYIGKFNNDKVIVHKVQFSSSFGEFKYPFIVSNNEVGMNQECNIEGIHFKNFFGTYSLGPFLIINPLFTQYLLKTLGLNDTIAFKDDIVNAYYSRIKKIEDYYKGGKNE